MTALPGPVRAALARRGVDPADLIAAVDNDHDDAVLLTGSYARGEAHAASDVDLLVLTRRERPRRIDGTLCFPSVLGYSVDRQRGDVHLNVEYVARKRLAELARIVAPPTAGTARLPNLQALELRLVDGLHTGAILRGEADVALLRRMLSLDAVRASAAALAFLGTLDLLGKSTAAAEPAAAVLRRAAGESLLFAGVTAFGRLTYDVKHVVSRAAGLAHRPGVPRLFVRHEEVLFVDRLPADAGTALLVGLAAELHRALRGPDCPQGIVALLEPFRPSWVWTEGEF
jgi:hypothetical protein